MPKIVDHDARRLELVEVTWKVIARRGFDGVTLRDIAAEAGFANGALKPYFPTRASLIRATFSHVFGRTNSRIATSTRCEDIAHAHGLPIDVADIAFAEECMRWQDTPQPSPPQRERDGPL